MEPNIFYGNTAGGSCPTIMTSYDPATDTTTSFPLTSTASPFCNGRGMAWDGAHLWYTVVGGSTGFLGDGLIHEVGTAGGADLMTMPDPYGASGRGIGAMKFDAPLPGGHLWVESYNPVSSLVEVSELAVPAGTVLASCELPFRGGGVGSDTFSLFTGGEFATDGGEILTTLFFYSLPTAGSFGTSCVQVGPSVSIAGATGLNFASNGDCIYTNAGGTTFNGAGTCALPSKASTTNGFPAETEDISCTTLPTTGGLCKLAPPINNAPEFNVSAIIVSATAMIALAALRLARKQQVPTLSV